MIIGFKTFVNQMLSICGAVSWGGDTNFKERQKIYRINLIIPIHHTSFLKILI